MTADSSHISQLTRREIQAPVAACLIRAFAARVGPEQALQIATQAIQADAESAGASVAARLGGNTLRELARVVREIWAQDEAISVDFLEESAGVLRFDVTRCRYAECYRSAGLLEYGYCLSCSRDEAFARGFNPAIRLTRATTIMQGDPVCDFCFALQQPTAPSTHAGTQE